MAPYSAAELWFKVAELVVSSGAGTLCLIYALSLMGLWPRAEKIIPPKPKEEIDENTGC